MGVGEFEIFFLQKAEVLQVGGQTLLNRGYGGGLGYILKTQFQPRTATFTEFSGRWDCGPIFQR